MLERLVESLSFEAPDRAGAEVVIDDAYVRSQLDELVKDDDLTRYIL